MIISAIYFKDKECSHLKIVDSYGSPSHILINGKVIEPSHNGSWKPDDFIVEGDVKEIKAAIKKTVVSHYMNRETEETMSVQVYEDSIKSFKNGNGDYKDLESEYLCRKMKQTYIPVNKTYYEYEDVVFIHQEADLQPDKYCRCDGVVSKDDDAKKRNFFVYKFDKWTFCNDLVKRLMEEYGIQRVQSKNEATSNEYYILHDKAREYKWLEFCDIEYFRNYKDMFQNDYDKPTYIYGTYDDCMACENDIEKNMRNRIETYLDKIRVTSVKKSDLKAIYDGLKDLEQSAINNKNKTKKEIAQDLRMFLYKFSELAKIK